jgi:chemotaxis protein methyltransferase CheR
MADPARHAELPALEELARWVEARLGLHYPSHLWPALHRGVEAAARRLGLPDAEACAQRALAGALGDEGQAVLMECLAVGETYFFRDPELFEQLARLVLMPIITERRAGSRHLRLWSAGCSTGEEAYSLAMLAASLLPDWRDWNISVLGTDLNGTALRRARGGAYGDWSLRHPMPARYRAFLQQGRDGKHHVCPELRRRVRFEALNLAGAAYPSAVTGTIGMDLVLCRNVLIYFERERIRTVLGRLGGALSDAGWLVPGSVELPAAPIAGLSVVRKDGLFALRRSAAVPEAVVAPAATPALCAPALRAPASPAIVPLQPGRAGPDLLQQARARADAGDLEGAEQSCRDAVAQDKLDEDCTYLLASILAERGATGEAMGLLQRTLYLAPEHLLARFLLGSLALRLGQRDVGRRHLSHALARLADVAAEEVVQGSGGLTARELEEAIRQAEAAAR